ncbi:hypothetical protein BC832DRAFT_245248 [Gaertneriomyces semiglobifer]|nr:hypothetical protein BC832DRAFT_245248 [Gaertneriomyces semiglobifer]
MFPDEHLTLTPRNIRRRIFIGDVGPSGTGSPGNESWRLDQEQQQSPSLDSCRRRETSPAMFTLYRDRTKLEREEEDDDSGDDHAFMAVTPIPRCPRIRRTNSLYLNIAQPGQLSGQALQASTTTRLGAAVSQDTMQMDFAKRRNSDAMSISGEGSDSMMLSTPERPVEKRISASVSGKPLSRIQTLLKEETQPFAKEIAHERALNLAASQVLGDMDENTPPVSPMNTSTAIHSCEMEDEALTPLPVPVRTVAIPNSALKDPATYVSHSSKLNPENSFLSRQQEMMSCSPLLSPVHTSFTMSMSMSPCNAERKGKRKQSGDAERFEPYSKRQHRMPSSPTVHSPSVGALRTSSTPPPFSLPFPLVFQRQRSPSVSSTSSVTSMWGVERNGAIAPNGNGYSLTMPSVANTNPTLAMPNAVQLTNGGAVPPPSPRTLGALLNLGGTQEGFNKMKINE